MLWMDVWGRCLAVPEEWLTQKFFANRDRETLWLSWQIVFTNGGQDNASFRRTCSGRQEVLCVTSCVLSHTAGTSVLLTSIVRWQTKRQNKMKPDSKTKREWVIHHHGCRYYVNV